VAAGGAEVVEGPKVPETHVAAAEEAAGKPAEPWAEEDLAEEHMTENNLPSVDMDYKLVGGQEVELVVESSGVSGGIAVAVVVPAVAAVVVAAAAIAFDYFACHSRSWHKEHFGPQEAWVAEALSTVPED
jgi:hypothetical protein